MIYLNGDHLSSTALATTNTGAFQTGQGYYGYGKYRTGGVLPTRPAGSRRYTGQKLDAATGLYYYGARYYDRNIGMFVSPDTLVPDPTNVWDYNRYGYARLNPLKYNDPSGHIAICFHGGPQNDEGIALDASVSELCSEGLRQGGYDPKMHGTIIALKNSDADIEFALRQVLAAQAANPYEPVILVGHSWGGAAALDLAYRLSQAQNLVPAQYPGLEIPNKPIEVDLLFLLDSENDLRTIGGLYPGSGSINSPDGIYSNVRNAINVYAQDWNSGIWGREFPGNPQNGMNYIQGAVNIGLRVSRFEKGQARPADHWNVVQYRGSINTTTKNLLADHVQLYFTGYDGQ